MAMQALNVSVVINTFNRADDLARTLESFRWLDSAVPFEVVVVNGPSVDHTEDVIAAAGHTVRVHRCPVANLSMSRNVGICAAAGQIVAFIDDDAIPEPEWLTQLVGAYDDPSVAAAGGFVFDHTGHAFQYKFGTADRLGNARIALDAPSSELNFPFSFEYPHLLGTNASFRKSALLEIGGFDEEYEYFLDETDVMVRLVDAGYTIAQLSNAFVHHKFAPSHLRNHRRILKNRYPVLKNKVYFCIKQSRRFVGLDGAMRAISDFFDAQRREVRWLIGENLADADELQVLETTIEKAYERGMSRGLANDPVMIRPGADQSHCSEFRPFTTIDNPARLCLVLLSGDYPPNRSGGIATLTADLAHGLACAGHRVHVITRSKDIDRVDFEGGVWVHRIVSKPHDRKAAGSFVIPGAIWDWSATAYDEASRIAAHRRIDCIEAPIWDCEGVAFLLARRWPVVVSLQTTFHFWLDSHPALRLDAAWMASMGTPMLDLEKFVLLHADGIRAISQTIHRDVERAYGVELQASKVHAIPVGIRWIDAQPNALSPARSEDDLVVLFVGRLEKRKGIDTLLDAVPRVLQSFPRIRFQIVGDDTIVDEDGKTFRRLFEERSDDATRAAVAFEGRLDDHRLEAAYASCNIFVAPSRYESFGLVYVEAMRAGKPVVGCEVGGVPEVVDQHSGVLVPPDRPDLLAAAIMKLASDSALRSDMGLEARRAFEHRFTATRMAEQSMDLYRTACCSASKRDEREQTSCGKSTR